MQMSTLSQRDKPETFTITQLAEEFGITTRAIRFYEDKDLIHPERNGLNRIYSRRDRARLALILRGKRLGFSLAEVREMLDLYDVGDGQREQLKYTLRKSRERLETLRSQRRDIDDAIAELEEGCRQIEQVLARKHKAER
ncbi:MAG TPA: MerR family DNA-binding transcriptional regulator [Alphaproteobacteria bacterium]|nr:MerR family DNA-binding transcriptional regulator [Alphaproteobacteria bacterium]